MTRIAVMCGATCVVVRILTTKAYSSNSWRLYYKKSTSSTYSSITLQNNDNLFFITSSWEADVYGLSAQTTYNFYVTAGNESSNTITATTCAAGVFRYTLDYAEGTSPSIYSSDYQHAETLLEEFKGKMIAVGFNLDIYDSSWTPSFLVDKNTSFSYTEGHNKGTIHLAASVTIKTIAHEFRHSVFFTNDVVPELGYATDADASFLPQTQAEMDNFYGILSFLSCNNGKREIYTFYGESTGTDSISNIYFSNIYLFTLFELKALAKNWSNAYIYE